MITSCKIGAINTIMLTIGVFIVGIFLSLVVYNILNKGFLTPEDLVRFVSDDIDHYVSALSSADGGVKYYSMPNAVNIKTESNSITISKDSASETIFVLGELETTELEASRICIVKKLSTGKIHFFDAGNSLCNPN